MRDPPASGDALHQARATAPSETQVEGTSAAPAVAADCPCARKMYASDATLLNTRSGVANHNGGVEVRHDGIQGRAPQGNEHRHWVVRWSRNMCTPTAPTIAADPRLSVARCSTKWRICCSPKLSRRHVRGWRSPPSRASDIPCANKVNDRETGLRLRRGESDADTGAEWPPPRGHEERARAASLSPGLRPSGMPCRDYSRKRDRVAAEAFTHRGERGAELAGPDKGPTQGPASPRMSSALHRTPANAPTA